MKKPKSIIIQGHTYQIISDKSKECKKELEEDSQELGLRGCIRYNTQKVYIFPDQHPESWYLTLIHECVHGFYKHMDIKDKEKDIDNIAACIFTFLKENKLWQIK